MTTLRAHFDGRVIVPDEPVNLPTNRTLNVTIEEAEPSFPLNDYPIVRHPMTGLPMFQLPPHIKPISLEDIRSAEDEI